MKKLTLIAALVAAWAIQPGWAAEKAKSSCVSPSAIEAEQAIRYVTDLMIVSSACQDIGDATAIYGGFRVRNRDVIVGYQKALIQRFHGNAGFDKWNTSLANAAASKQGGNQQICQQSVALLKEASALDPKGFQAVAAAKAVADTVTANGAKERAAAG